MPTRDVQSTDERNARYDPMTRDELIAECELLRADLAIQAVNATAVLQAQHERDVAIEKVGQLRAFLLQGREALGSFETRQSAGWLAELDAAIGSAPDVGGGT